MNQKEYISQYKNPDLCAKWDNNIPASELQGNGMILSLDWNDILGVKEYWGLNPDGMTGIIYRVGDGDYEEVYVTESSRPYSLDAIYHPLDYYLD
jgi:hypothetical protein